MNLSEAITESCDAIDEWMESLSSLRAIGIWLDNDPGSIPARLWLPAITRFINANRNITNSGIEPPLNNLDDGHAVVRLAALHFADEAIEAISSDDDDCFAIVCDKFIDSISFGSL